MAGTISANGLGQDGVSEATSSHSALRPRAYQIEMFNHSMKGNIIVTMETGSGKSLAAKLRIEAELQRTPNKLIWMTTPMVELSKQQHDFLTRELPAYSFRLITGLDNVQYWTSKSVWDAALFKIDGVVSTPQVLLDALSHGFVSLQNISLLVIDEAHHCMAKSPSNKIMQQFYHSSRASPGHVAYPNIMGLTASPINTDKASNLEKLEQNLNAVCKTPAIELEEYRLHVHLPQLVRLPYVLKETTPTEIVQLLTDIVRTYNLDKDPTFLRYRSDRSLKGKQKFEEIVSKQRTPVLIQLKKLLNNAADLAASLGSWAATLYTRTCLEKLHNMVSNRQTWLYSLSDNCVAHMDDVIEPVRRWLSHQPSHYPRESEVSNKVSALVQYLKREYCEGIACIVFVQRRSTAYALWKLFSILPDMHSYNVFTFVGLSNALQREVTDLADREAQQEAFADFKGGRRNLCIATQVLEEGIDIQACNIVVRFDQPATFRSFIQSRGRARHPNSKFVLLHDESDALAKYANWKVLEDDMKMQYAAREELVAKLEAIEAEDEDCDRVFRVQSTGAVLTFDNAKQHLQHFCAKLSTTAEHETPEPIYIMEGNPDELRSCKVILPSSISPLLQSTSALSKWRTERMAKKDAAFEAYKRLYHAGLVNEHLLPPLPLKEYFDSDIETRNSTYNAARLFNPWQSIKNALLKQPLLFAHRISIAGPDIALPTLLLLLPIPVYHLDACKLNVYPEKQLTVTIAFLGHWKDEEISICQDITQFLFATVLSRRLTAFEANGSIYPYLVIPEYPKTTFADWLAKSRQVFPLLNSVFSSSLTGQRYLILPKGHSIPYLFTPSIGQATTMRLQQGDTVEAVRLPKRIDFLTRTTHYVSPKLHSLEVDDCTVLSLSAGYGEAMVFMPSILHFVEGSLRAQAAREGPLKTIGYQNLNSVMTALTAPAAGLINYQRLEYVGDMLLKFYTAVNLFCQHSQMTEYHLTVMAGRLMNNARLQRATRELELEAYLTDTPFSGHEWTPEVKQPETHDRRLSSKVLADVIEALLGAAYTDVDNDKIAETKILSALTLFLPEVAWRTSEEAASLYKRSPDLPSHIAPKLSAVQNMIGYNFRNLGLLTEAMTCSTQQVGCSSYERLEFLGDACLDRIVKWELYQSPHEFAEEAMSRRQYALVNQHILAFFATRMYHHKDWYNVSTNLETRQPEFHTEPQKIYLNDYVIRNNDTNVAGRRAEYLHHFHEYHDRIFNALQHGTEYPWADLYHLNAAKPYSDIIESLLGAIFIDSDGNIEACRVMLDKIGLMAIVRRLASTKDIVLSSPLERVRMLQERVKVQSKLAGSQRRGNRSWVCTLSVVDEDDQTEVVIGHSGTEEEEGVVITCRAEAEQRAAEDALRRGLIKKKRKRDVEGNDSTDGRGDEQNRRLAHMDEDEEEEGEGEVVVDQDEGERKGKGDSGESDDDGRGGGMMLM